MPKKGAVVGVGVEERKPVVELVEEAEGAEAEAVERLPKKAKAVVQGRKKQLQKWNPRRSASFVIKKKFCVNYTLCNN